MITDNGLIEKTFEQFDKSHYSNDSMREVLNYFEFCSYDINKMCPNTFYEYIYKKKIKFMNAHFAWGIIKNVLVNNFNIDKKLWDVDGVAKNIINHCDMKYETKDLINNFEWNDFQVYAKDFLENKKYIPFFKNYIKLSFSWNGINQFYFSKIDSRNLCMYEDTVLLMVEGFQYIIKDKLLYSSIEKVLKEENNNFLFLKDIRNKNTKLNFFKLNYQDVYYSGCSYLLSKNKNIYISGANRYLMPYLKAISEYMYGENREE